jgi:preprotein translocase subunit SecD
MLSPTSARGRLLKGDGVRSRPSFVLIVIIFITLVAGWIDLPGDTLDVFGIKEDVEVSEGLDLQGGVQVLLEANPPEGQEVDSDTLKGTRDTIERRVNGLGVSEPLIQTRGENQIIVSSRRGTTRRRRSPSSSGPRCARSSTRRARHSRSERALRRPGQPPGVGH